MYSKIRMFLSKIDKVFKEANLIGKYEVEGVVGATHGRV